MGENIVFINKKNIQAYLEKLEEELNGIDRGVNCSRSEKVEKYRKAMNTWRELFSENGRIYEIEGEKYRIRLNFICRKGNWRRFEFAPEASNIFITKVIQSNKANFMNIVLKRVRKYILDNRRNNEEKVEEIQRVKLDNNEQEEQQR